MKKIIGKVTLATILLSVLTVGFLGLIAYNVRDMVFGAPLVIHTVADGSTITGDYVAITGNAQHAGSLTINDRPIGVDENGNFNDGVILSPGYNIVKVAETDQFGKEKIETFHWVAIPAIAVAQNDISPYQR
jgi:hypothetical protein